MVLQWRETLFACFWSLNGVKPPPSALQVIEMLHERARQRRRLVDFLLRNPSPCDCVDGGAAHVHAYFYSPRVSDYAGILPLEFVYKSLSS